MRSRPAALLAAVLALAAPATAAARPLERSLPRPEIPAPGYLPPPLAAGPSGLSALSLLAEPGGPAPTPFERIVRRPEERRSHRLALYTALAGAALVAASFPISDEADRRYERYLVEVDVARMDRRFREAERLDRYAAVALIAGETLLATAVWLRFVREPERRRFALEVGPDRCGVALRY